MRVLVIGGTGLISRGIVKRLLARGAEVKVFNRGKCSGASLPADVRAVLGDRDDAAALSAVARANFDVVIDMVCFRNEQATAAVAASAASAGTTYSAPPVCTYGTGSPSKVLIDESSPQQPTSAYGRDKVACERAFFAAHRAGRFAITIIRPSQTYGPGGPMIDNLEFDAVAWDRIDRGLPVLCASDGLGQWGSTHRDDCGKLFAYAALRPLHLRQGVQRHSATAHDLVPILPPSVGRIGKGGATDLHASGLD
jgi:nucleoside-diphosphate-sugar epimerase